MAPREKTPEMSDATLKAQMRPATQASHAARRAHAARTE